MVEHGLASETRVLSSGIGSAPGHVGPALDLPVGSAVVYLRRLRSIAREPVAIHHSYLPTTLAKRLNKDLTGSLTEMLAGLGARVSTVADVLEAVAAREDAAALHDIEVGDPPVRITGTARASDGIAIRYSDAVLVPRRHQRHRRFGSPALVGTCARARDAASRRQPAPHTESAPSGGPYPAPVSQRDSGARPVCRWSFVVEQDGATREAPPRPSGHARSLW
jgi:hypothetical protein